jgi:tetratricopeptide (TPR) repeat protein
MNRTIDLQPDQSVSFRQRGDCYYALKDYQAAIADYTQALELQPDNDIYYQLRGLTHHALRRFAKATEDLSRAIDIDPQNTLHYYWRSLVVVNMQEYDFALADMNRSQELDSADPLTQAFCACWRGVIYALKGQGDDSRREIEQAEMASHQVEDADQKQRVQAVLALWKGDTELARKRYQIVIGKEPKPHLLFSPSLYLHQLARLFPAREDIQEMVIWFEAQFT